MNIDYEVSYKSLRRLVEGEISAIHCKEFVPPEQAKLLSEKILVPGYERYINAPSIGRIGMAFYEAEGRPDKMEEYFEMAKGNIEDLRHRCSPYASPIDVLRCRLDELWPAGAGLESLYGKKMYVGLSRVVEPSVTFLAHHDIFEKDAPDSFRASSLVAQVACNVYLTMPEKGGELQLWSREIPAKEFDQMRQEDYGIPPLELGEPQVEILPAPEDLILFNSRLMHAVAPGERKPRLSLSCFVGCRGPSTPLTFWS